MAWNAGTGQWGLTPRGQGEPGRKGQACLKEDIEEELEEGEDDDQGSGDDDGS